MLKPTYPYYLANEPHGPNADLEVTDKFTGEVVARVAMASPAVIDQAIAAAVAAVEPMGMLAAYERQDILYHCVKRFEERFEELAMVLCIEAGKPIKDARGEAARRRPSLPPFWRAAPHAAPRARAATHRSARGC